MLDIRRIKDNPEEIKRLLRAKEVDCDEAVDKILELDQKRRELIASTEAKKAEQNKVSKQIPVLKKQGQDVAPIFQQMTELKNQIAANDSALADVEAEYRTWMLSLPNLPDPDLKPGGKENNEPLRYFGEPHHFDFEPKHHVDLCTDLGLQLRHLLEDGGHVLALLLQHGDLLGDLVLLRLLGLGGGDELPAPGVKLQNAVHGGVAVHFLSPEQPLDLLGIFLDSANIQHIVYLLFQDFQSIFSAS